MATTNVVVGKTPIKIVNANNNFFLSLPWYSEEILLWATTSTPGTQPAVETWHLLNGKKNEKLNRGVIETDLEVWAYCPQGSVTIVLE